MASRDMLADLARHAELLGANVAKLTRALDHWRLLEAEYEALAEEVRRAEEDFGVKGQDLQAELVRIRRDFDGQLVDHRTVCELFGARLGQPITRSSEQIGRAVARRLDYVRQNAATLQKQVEGAANRLAAAEVIRNPGGTADADDDGAFEPVTDIVEELDEDDNVVNVRLNTPSTVAPDVLTALKKAGIEELGEGEGGGDKNEDDKEKEEKEEAKGEIKRETKPGETKADASKQPQEPTPTPTPKPNLKPTPKPRRSVAFAEDTKGGHEDSKQKRKEQLVDDVADGYEDDDAENGDEASQQPPSFAAQRLERVMRAAAEQEAMARAVAAGGGAGVAGPADESAEDAALRREMLAYSQSEIGPIVAQLDLEEGEEEEEEWDDGSDFYGSEFEEEEEDDEDEHGRSKYSVIDEEYRARMQELEKKLGVARPLSEEAPAVDDAAEKLGRIRIAGGTTEGSGVNGTATTATTPASSLKKAGAAGGQKKVAFAATLDVSTPNASEPIAPAAAAPAPAKPSKLLVEPVRDVVVERGSSSSAQTPAPFPPTAAAPKKASRFKKAREAGPTPTLSKGPHEAPVRFLDQDCAVAPSGPEGCTLAEAVVERQPSAAREPDELDAGLLLQETAAAYHRTRNRLIQQQGGFLRASEAAVVPLEQAEGGPRVSKFKAARLGRDLI